MSADNWARCPRCAKRSPQQEQQRTFREDYEIYGAEDGTVTVSYRGHCRDCHLALTFTYERDLDVDGAS